MLTAGQLAREIAFASCKADKVQHVPGAGIAGGAVLAAHFQRKGDVVQNGPVRQKAKALEHHPHLAAAQVDQGGLGQGADIGSFDGHTAARDLDQSRQAAHQRRLARAGQPHDHQHLAARDIQINVTHRVHIAHLGRTWVCRHLCQMPDRVRPKDLAHIAAGNDGVAHTWPRCLNMSTHPANCRMGHQSWIWQAQLNQAFQTSGLASIQALAASSGSMPSISTSLAISAIWALVRVTLDRVA